MRVDSSCRFAAADSGQVRFKIVQILKNRKKKNHVKNQKKRENTTKNPTNKNRVGKKH
jgi:hypothetical protein